MKIKIKANQIFACVLTLGIFAITIAFHNINLLWWMIIPGAIIIEENDN